MRTRLRAHTDTGAEVQALQDEFGIDGAVSFESGRGGLPKAVLTHVCGSKVEVYLYGANVLSWCQPRGDEILYVRPDAKFDKSKAISGGIPVCFPQFGPGALRQHGFARDSDWGVASTSADDNPDDPDPSIELMLEDNESTIAEWPHKFKVVYTITLHRDVLQTEFRVFNTGDGDFDVTAALHSYFEVAGIRNAHVAGLEALPFLDKIPNPSDPVERAQAGDVIEFKGPTDSVYKNAPQEVVLSVGTGAGIQIQNEGWTDAVVWNPWTEMPECYDSFACVENAVAVTPVVVPPGGSWLARADFAVIDL